MFRFIIKYFDDIEESLAICKGIIKAEDYENAVREIIDYIGGADNLVSIERLYELDDVLEDNDIIKGIIN